jgi:hypothetical protein
MEAIFPEDIDYFVSGIDLIDMIIRVHKRKDYYQHFHGMNINEHKTVAIVAYWILKLRPIQMRDARFINKTEACNINEKFALYLIFHVLNQYRED